MIMSAAKNLNDDRHSAEPDELVEESIQFQSKDRTAGNGDSIMEVEEHGNLDEEPMEEDTDDDGSSGGSDTQSQPDDHIRDEQNDSEQEMEDSDQSSEAGEGGDQVLSLTKMEDLIISRNHGLPPSLVVDADCQKPTDASASEQIRKINKKSKSIPSDLASPLPSPLPLSKSSLTLVTPHPLEEIHFSPKTIRRVMSYITSCHDVRISHPSVKAVAVALECFVQSFIQEAFRHAQRNHRNLIKYTDIAYVANHFSTLYFLQEFLPQPQPAGYVVKKILDSAGVDTDQNFAVDGLDDAEGDEDEEKNSSATKAATTGRKGGTIVGSALNLARKWDKEPSSGHWRGMASKPDSRKVIKSSHKSSL